MRLTVSVLLGVIHAGVLLLVAARLGYAVGPGEYSLVGIGWRYGGLVVVAALPVWLALRYTLVAPVCDLLVRHRPVSPATLLAVFVLLDVRAEFVASVDDPHAFYFGAWFVFLGVILVAAGVELGGRRLALLERVQSAQ